MSEKPDGDPYSVLGLRRGATPLQVARAHRRLAKRFHPDLHPSPEAVREMQRINAAWRTLNAQLRTAESGPQGVRSRRPTADGAAPAGDGDAEGGAGSAAGHWSATRRPVWPEPRPAARGWTAWRAAEGGGAARAAGYTAPPSWSRGARTPSAAAPARESFRDSGWAAVVIGLVLVVIVLVAAGLGGQYWAAYRELQMQRRVEVVGD